MTKKSQQYGCEFFIFNFRVLQDAFRCKNLLYLAFDYDTIKGQITLRNRREGDRFLSAKTGITKKVKKLFSEAGFTPYRKSTVPLICDETGVIGMFHFGVKKGMDVRENTSDVLLFINDKTEE